MKPISISIEDKELLIKWDDDFFQRIKLVNLRYHCPCAFCEKERMDKRDTFIPLYLDKQISISGIKTIGNYALKIIWEDGHDGGIYEFGYLRKFTG